MESGIQSSFIPQDASRPTAVPRASGGSGGLGELGLLISIVLLVASAALAGAVFLYSEYATTNAASKVTQLQRAKDAFEPSLITQITRLDDRMRAADAILAAHTAPLTIFDTLQGGTLSTVSYSQLSYSGFDPQNMTIKMVGVAQSVNSIALQADVLSKDGVIINPIFSDITRQSDGVHFTLSAAINPAAINYVQGGAHSQAAAASVPIQTQASPFGGIQTQSPGTPLNAATTTQ
ncbi:MAG: hypothetical protein JWM46_822 [Candidatus Kaiserbacteria bacterium]|nr:hypothetical protein [Candidatus Kaiserbacteria bacterium]